jgi:hypothetical protein
VSSTRALVEMSWRWLVAGNEAVAMVTWRNCQSRVRGYLASYERSLVEGLAKLCRAAPSDTVRSVLGVWSPSKPGNEIRVTWQQGKRFLAPDLKGTLAWLTNSRECDIKGTKHDVAQLLLVALESLLPDTCQLCKEIYTVEREDTPSLRCKGCSQGFHQSCYDRLEVGPSLAELPGVLLALLSLCSSLPASDSCWWEQGPGEAQAFQQGTTITAANSVT